MKRIIAFLIALVAVVAAFAEYNVMLAPQQKYGGKFGYVNANGLYVIPAKFDDARHFFNDFAAVEINGKWGFINRQGRFLVKPQYRFVMDFNRGYAIVRDFNGKWGAVNTKGELEIPCEYDRHEDLLNLKVIRLTPEQVEMLKKLGL
nr:WG repeat-containing protein [Bacteroides sp.]